MNEDTRKSLIRHIRREMVRYLPSLVEETYSLGKLTAKLIPGWIESGDGSFELYLANNGLPPKLAMMALTYDEVPSLEIWKTLGYEGVARAAQKRRREECLDALLDSGASPLDVMGLPYL